MGDFLDLKTLILFGIIIMTLLAAIISISRNRKIHQKQEEEIQLYRVYVKPLEELIKEIRAKQHEFDNHLNAILNMHISIEDYDTLVEQQSSYIKTVIEEQNQTYISLLCISDKVLAGFIYSKLNAVKDKIKVELHIGNREIIAHTPESELIEIVGTLIDNAVEACTGEKKQIILFLSSDNDKMIFEIKNRFEKLPIETLAVFFEYGYSTKSSKKNHGLGLWNAKKIVERWNGEIFVENQEIDGINYISIRVEV